MKKIYLASPLFNESEQDFNSKLAHKIRTSFEGKVLLYNPQENDEINDKSGYADSQDIFVGDTTHLDESDILIANLDGLSIDPGVAAEMGYFYTLDRPIIGLYTDVRQGTFGNQLKIDALDDVAESQFSYVNLYVVGLNKFRGPIATSSDELLHELSILVGD